MNDVFNQLKQLGSSLQKIREAERTIEEEKREQWYQKVLTKYDVKDNEVARILYTKAQVYCPEKGYTIDEVFMDFVETVREFGVDV